MTARAEVSFKQDVRQRLLADYGRTLILVPGDKDDPERLFDKVCAEFENVKIEQDEEGNVYIMAPVGAESSDQNTELTMQLRLWAKQDGRGECLVRMPSSFSQSVEARHDAAWIRNEKLAVLPRSERRKFAPVIPDFVVELKSPTDRLSKLKQKMLDYRQNGVDLAWLIDPDQQTVWIYRAGDEVPEVFLGSRLAADGPIAGFVVDLQPIWKGLDF